MLCKCTSIIILSMCIVQTPAEQCITPNNEKAECTTLYSCPVLITALATQQNASVEFVRQSNCGGTASNPMVCCGSLSNFTISGIKNSTNNQSKNVTKINLLPTRRYCGYQHSDDYFPTANDTSTRITEFPWLAGLKYRRQLPNHGRSDQVKLLCGGSLINNRYILTAAQCLFSREGTLVAVHLGEYNVNNATDCVQEPPFDQECSEPLVIADIEKAIPHPNYSPRSKTNDIALLRLKEKVKYSDYVRPICLPLSDTINAKVGDAVISTGWGNRNFFEETVETKKKTISTLITNEKCAQVYNSNRINITGNHLCASGFSNNTASECQGDGGGPLMFSHRSQWQQEGVISLGRACGAFPDVYTKVANYVDWILENIES